MDGVQQKGVKVMLKITLKAARVNIGKTLKEAAAEFGFHYETLSNYETDSTNVPRTFLIKLEAVYGIPMEYIYFGRHSDYIAELKDNMLKQEA
jgi:transcriptional regulator with XRE-family HTH domain